MLDGIIEFILKGARLYGFDEPMIKKIHLVSEEVAANIINYAYPGSSGAMDIIYSIEEHNNTRSFVLVFIDDGLAFNPLELPEPDINAPIEERTIGGLGIFLVKSLMDDVTYKRHNDQNILRLVKH